MFKQSCMASIGGSEIFASYAQFKTVFMFEKYLDNVKSINYRKALCKCRLKSLYFKPCYKKINTLCDFCKLDIEDEYHIIYKCPLYAEYFKKSIV